MKHTMIFAVIACFSALAANAAFAGPMKSSPELLEKGKASFTTNCALCHGDKGDGNGPAGAAMDPKPRNFAKDKFKKGTKPAQVFETITKGLDGTSMAAYGHLSEEERWGLAYYVLELRKAK